MYITMCCITLVVFSIGETKNWGPQLSQFDGFISLELYVSHKNVYIIDSLTMF